jgi:hypothetical protein
MIQAYQHRAVSRAGEALYDAHHPYSGVVSGQAGSPPPFAVRDLTAGVEQKLDSH